MQSNRIDRQKIKGGVIVSVLKGSLGETLGLQLGDILTSLNGTKLESILDYRYEVASEILHIEVARDGSLLKFEVEKDYDEDLGLEFDDVLFDRIQRCQNNCDFCFIYQLPKGMRRSLYIKDDDYRLSFLYGNYVTLAGLSDTDFEKIEKYRLSPLYVSVHATDLCTRRKLLKNPLAEDIIPQIQRLLDAGIEVYTQAVICPGLNDGEILEQTMVELSKLYPGVSALGVVPVGLTQFQSRLKRMNPHTPAEARSCVESVQKFQQKIRKETGNSFVQLADEFYIRADVPFPEPGEYEHYDLMENGIGGSTKFLEDFQSFYDPNTPDPKERIGLITGMDGSEIFHKYLLPKLKNNHREKIRVYGIKNEHFGSSVTVSGLIVGGDILAQVPKGECGRYLLPMNSLKFDTPVFLDDVKLTDLEKSLGAPVIPIPETALDLLEGVFEG
jgi:putative radical SAM enzyme (TIGR03279 family)